MFHVKHLLFFLFYFPGNISQTFTLTSFFSDSLYIFFFFHFIMFHVKHSLSFLFLFPGKYFPSFCYSFVCFSDSLYIFFFFHFFCFTWNIHFSFFFLFSRKYFQGFCSCFVYFFDLLYIFFFFHYRVCLCIIFFLICFCWINFLCFSTYNIRYRKHYFPGNILFLIKKSKHHCLLFSLIFLNADFKRIEHFCCISISSIWLYSIGFNLTLSSVTGAA